MLRGAAPAPSWAEILRPLFSLATILIAGGCLGVIFWSRESSWVGPGPWVFYPFGAGPTGEGLGISAWILGGAWLLAFAIFGVSWLSRPRSRWAVPVLVVAGLVFIFGLLLIIESVFNAPGVIVPAPY